MSTRAQDELFKHLAECSDCQSFIEAMVKIKDAQHSEQITFPADLDDEVFSAVARSRATSGNFTHSRKLFMKRRIALTVPVAAAAALIAIVLGILVGAFVVPLSDRPAATSSWQHLAEQPATVIMIYGIPPVEIHDTRLAQPVRENGRIQN